MLAHQQKFVTVYACNMRAVPRQNLWKNNTFQISITARS